MAAADEFTFTNLTGRPPGPFLRTLGRVLPGVAAVQREVQPYAAAWRQMNLSALEGGQVRWVALGDSMTQGIGATAPERGWVGQLHARLASPVDVINLSQSGGRVEDVISDQLPAWRRLGPAPAGEIVTVLIGSNDAMSPRHRRLMVEAFEELLSLLPAGAIVSELGSPAPQTVQVNALIGAAGARGAITVVDISRAGPASWRGKLAADRFHPNDAGYALIADMFEPAVRAALSVRVGPGA